MNPETQKLKNNEIVEFLFKEKDIARQEVFVDVKIVSQVSTILLPFFFAGIGLLVQYGENGNNIKILEYDKLPLLLILINQILFLIWMYGLSIVSNLAVLAGYIMALEEKINYHSSEMISSWESLVQPKYTRKWYSGQIISTIFWNLLYFLLFCFSTYYTFPYCLKQHLVFFVIECIEIIVIIIVYCLTPNARKKSYELTRMKYPKQ